MAFTSRITLLAALAVAAFQAQAVNVTVAYQTSAEPAKVAQADNTFAKTSGATVDWRKFDSGASVVRATGFTYNDVTQQVQLLSKVKVSHVPTRH